MPDELINDDGEQTQTEVIQDEKTTRSDNRFKDLSEKVKTTAEERDTFAKEAEAAKKETEFYKGFSKVSSKYEGAADYQDKILEKVNAGYDLEDATISVLAKAGKFSAPQTQRESPAGGSATTAMRSQGEKTVAEMTLAEKREALLESEREAPGSLSQVLRKTNVG